jgi:hypothetical protein
VIAHECGHQAFSKWQAVNDAVGLVLHSLLLVPYYSWCASAAGAGSGRRSGKGGREGAAAAARRRAGEDAGRTAACWARR